MTEVNNAEDTGTVKDNSEGEENTSTDLRIYRAIIDSLRESERVPSIQDVAFSIGKLLSLSKLYYPEEDDNTETLVMMGKVASKSLDIKIDKALVDKVKDEVGLNIVFYPEVHIISLEDESINVGIDIASSKLILFGIDSISEEDEKRIHTGYDTVISDIENKLEAVNKYATSLIPENLAKSL